MGRSVRRVAVVVTVAFGGAVFAPAASADVYSCSFLAATGTIAPDDPLTNDGIQAMVKDFADLDPFDQDTGRYSFDSHFGGSEWATCLFVDDNLSGNGQSGVYEARISSMGRYVNEVCLTMGFMDILDSDVTRIELLPAAGQDGDSITDTEYDMDLTSGNGYVDFANGDNEDGVEQTENEVEPDGVINVIPFPERGDCVVEDLTHVEITGAFTMILTAAR